MPGGEGRDVFPFNHQTAAFGAGGIRALPLDFAQIRRHRLPEGHTNGRKFPGIIGGVALHETHAVLGNGLAVVGRIPDIAAGGGIFVAAAEEE